MKVNTPKSISEPASNSHTQQPSDASAMFDYFTFIRFKNTKTFLYQNDLHAIDEKNSLELDDYLFDVTELKEGAEQDLGSLYKNPHTKGSFTDVAKEKLRQLPLLAVFAKELDAQLASQEGKIKSQTIDAVLEMLRSFKALTQSAQFGETEFVTGSLESRAKFLAHMTSLSQKEQAELNQYQIILATGNQWPFRDAFKGGTWECIDMAQKFLWQFILDFRPNLFHEVPQKYRNVMRVGRQEPIRVISNLISNAREVFPQLVMSLASLTGFSAGRNLYSAAIERFNTARPRNLTQGLNSLSSWLQNRFINVSAHNTESLSPQSHRADIIFTAGIGFYTFGFLGVAAGIVAESGSRLVRNARNYSFNTQSNAPLFSTARTHQTQMVELINVDNDNPAADISFEP